MLPKRGFCSARTSPSVRADVYLAAPLPSRWTARTLSDSNQSIVIPHFTPASARCNFISSILAFGTSIDDVTVVCFFFQARKNFKRFRLHQRGFLFPNHAKL